MIKGVLCSMSVLIAFPFILVSFTFSRNFYLSISIYGVSYLAAESWYAPCVSMLLTLFPAQLSGLSIAIFSLSGSLMGALSNTLLGVFGDYFDTEHHPQRSGYLLTVAVGISYIGCSIPFLVSGCMYRNYIKLHKENIPSKTIFSSTMHSVPEIPQ
jgi:predicted membrane protein